MILAKRPRRILLQNKAQKTQSGAYINTYACGVAPRGSHTRAGTHAVGPRLRPHENRPRHPRTTHPNMASGCPRQPRPPLQLRLLFLIVYAPGAHGTEEEAEWDQGVSHGTRPFGHWLVSALGSVPHWIHWQSTGSGDGCAEAPKTRPPPSARQRDLLINLCSIRASPDRPRWPAWPSAPTA